MQDKEVLKLKIYEVLKKHNIEKAGLYEDLALEVNKYLAVKAADSYTSDIKNKIEHFLIPKRIDGLSDRTLENYLQQLMLFANYIKKSVEEITTDDIRLYIAYLTRERKIKNSTLLTYINILK